MSLNQLRSQLPRLAAELDEGIRQAACAIRAAAQSRPTELSAAHQIREQDWRKGLHDALLLLQPACDARERFEAWIREVIAQEVDHCGLTAAEREELFGNFARSHPMSNTNLSDFDLSDVGAALAGDATNFTVMLLRLIAKADPENRERLRVAYPEAVAAYEQWHITK